MEEEKKKETPTLAPPPGQVEDVYSASTVVGQAPKEILDLIAKSAEARATNEPKLAEPAPPKVLIKTPPAIPVTDFSMPEATTAKTAAVPESLSSSGLLDDDDWIIPDEAAKPPPPPPQRPPPTPVMAPFTPQAMNAALSEAADSGASLDAPASGPPASGPAQAAPSRPITPRADFAPASQSQPRLPVPLPMPMLIPTPPPMMAPAAPFPSGPSLRPVTPRAEFAPPPSQSTPRIQTPRADFAPASTGTVAPAVGAVLGLVAAPVGIPEERASAAKLLAAAPDPNVRVSRVDDEIFSVRNPPVEGAPGPAIEDTGASPMSDRPAAGQAAGHPGQSLHVPLLGDPEPASGNPNHLPIAAPPNSMHVPIGEARAPSHTPVVAIVAVGIVFVLLVLGAIVFAVLR